MRVCHPIGRNIGLTSTRSSIISIPTQASRRGSGRSFFDKSLWQVLIAETMRMTYTDQEWLSLSLPSLALSNRPVPQAASQLAFEFPARFHLSSQRLRSG